MSVMTQNTELVHSLKMQNKSLRDGNDILHQQCRDLMHEKNYWQNRFQKADLGETEDKEFNDYMSNHIIKDLKAENTRLKNQIKKLTQQLQFVSHDQSNRFTISPSPTVSLPSVQSYPFPMPSNCTITSKCLELDQSKTFEIEREPRPYFDSPNAMPGCMAEDDAKDTQSLSRSPSPPPFDMHALEHDTNDLDDQCLFDSVDVIQHAINNTHTGQCKAIYSKVTMTDDAICIPNDDDEKAVTLETVLEQNNLNDDDHNTEKQKIQSVDDASVDDSRVCAFLNTVSDSSSSSDAALIEGSGVNEIALECVYDGDISSSENNENDMDNENDSETDVSIIWTGNGKTIGDTEVLMMNGICDHYNESFASYDKQIAGWQENATNIKQVEERSRFVSNTSDDDSDLLDVMNNEDQDKENQDLNDKSVRNEHDVYHCGFSDASV
eukprot:673539_1